MTPSRVVLSQYLACTLSVLFCTLTVLHSLSAVLHSHSANSHVLSQHLPFNV
jgi:hypothetical protein